MGRFNKPITSFKNRTVLVVGASSGIGFEISKELRFLGKKLIVVARRVDVFEKHFPQNTFVETDIADDNSIDNFFEVIEKEGLSIDTVFWCAAIYTPMSYVDFSYEEAQKITTINLTSIYKPFRTITQKWIKNRNRFVENPHWIWISSVAGYAGLPSSCAYGPTKSALNNVAESAFVEFKPFNIDISLVCPGFVDTRLTKNIDFLCPLLFPPKKHLERYLTDYIREFSKSIFQRNLQLFFENHFFFPTDCFFNLPLN